MRNEFIVALQLLCLFRYNFSWSIQNEALNSVKKKHMFMGSKKFVSGAALILFSITAISQEHKLTKIWETDHNLKVPESVLYDAHEKTLYFSNIDGKPAEKDGKGSIGKMSSNGMNVTIEWLTGLNAPKGMGIFDNMLYVSDVDEVVSIDLKKASIVQRMPVEGAQFLNDVAVDDKGRVFVSDMKTGTIHRIEAGKSSVFLDKIEGANGLLSVGEDLYILAKGVLWKCGADKKLLKVADGLDESTDGVVRTNSGDFIVSCWAGVIYYVKTNGQVQQMLDSRPEKSNTADIGFDPDSGTLFVPTFFANSVAAYRLK
jgi:sugar lactone lactonase YvrE